LSRTVAEVIVAGHICLDIIPTIYEKQSGVNALLVPGKLVEIGPAVISTGGAVSNTGIALHHLGSKVNLMGKIGKDQFGEAILAILRQHSAALVDGMIVSGNENSSYSIVISPPHIDRTFLHSTGANDTYSSADLSLEQLKGARLFHFGYPPLMRRMYENDGDELALLLKKVKDIGITVSLDLAKPDPESDAGKANWRVIFEKALPYVDVFMPSFEEILYMLHRDRYDQWLQEAPSGDLLPFASGALLSDISEELLGMGAAIVGLKLGEHGLYVRTTSNKNRLSAMGSSAPAQGLLANWTNGELISACYRVDVVGTTGAGDCTIAGFLLGLMRGLSLEDSIHTAVGVGAHNVEQADATSGIPHWSEVRGRIGDGWVKLDMKLDLHHWSLKEDNLWVGPHHKSQEKGRQGR
jgi:sugar/nucleoside kinase (ribokinase family)